MISLSTMYPGTSIVLNSVIAHTGRSGSARVDRVPTLDGGVVLTHRGAYDGDRTLIFAIKCTEAEENILWGMYNDEILLMLAQHDGVYTGAISDIDCNFGDVRLTFLIEEKLT